MSFQHVFLETTGHNWSYYRLTLVFFPQCEEQICQSLALAQALANDVDMHVVVFRDFGKAKVKKCRVNPDAFIQIALQLAYYRVILPLELNKLSLYSLCACMFKKASCSRRKFYTVALISFACIFFKSSDCRTRKDLVWHTNPRWHVCSGRAGLRLFAPVLTRVVPSFGLWKVERWDRKSSLHEF